ncbi:hypothetical protein J1605_016884 [Eschrichtius robustus]|uniref:Endoplasmic reticulum-Golgi intermediate compartment protein n=1 Tax=Eschrichtius robustus TaxID=9764 RepID=A0AB34I258_ESCRO|nr:hypothetical protein J1605_016884 [Eschrichtius robustus]
MEPPAHTVPPPPHLDAHLPVPESCSVNELYVDDPDKDSGGKIDVSLNISLPNLHCELVGLDIQDEMGRHEVGHIDNSMRIPLNNGVGCRFEGQFSINKVPGNFHVSTHSATAQPQNPDMTHVIHKLSFGDTLQGSLMRQEAAPHLTDLELGPEKPFVQDPPAGVCLESSALSAVASAPMSIE